MEKLTIKFNQPPKKWTQLRCSVETRERMREIEKATTVKSMSELLEIIVSRLHAAVCGAASDGPQEKPVEIAEAFSQEEIRRLVELLGRG